MTPEPVPLLVEPEWLEARLEEPDLHVVDCTLHLSFDPETGARQSESGRSDWEVGHIPGSVFADVQDDLSAADPAYPYQRSTPERFARTMEALGIGDDSRVVCYDAAGNSWAARVWWLLRAFGFDRAGILNGGWDRWTAEDRPVSTAPPTEREVTFSPDHSTRPYLPATQTRGRPPDRPGLHRRRHSTPLDAEGVDRSDRFSHRGRLGGDGPRVSGRTRPA